MEVIDKRGANGHATIEEACASAMESLSHIISNLPCVYDDPAPMENNCLVKQNAAETTYRGTRFVIPDTARQSPNEGVVVAIGPNIDPEKLSPGDLVTFGRYNAEPIDVGGELFQLVSYHDIKLRKKVTYAIAAD